MKKIKAICLFCLLIQFTICSQVNYDSIIKTDIITVKIRSMSDEKIYMKMPAYMCLEITTNWPEYPYADQPMIFLKRPRSEQVYNMSLKYLKEHWIPKYDILSKSPPPISIQISDSSGNLIKNFRVPEEAYTLMQTGLPAINHDFKELPFTGISSGEKFNMLVDIRHFLFDLLPGNYGMMICFQLRGSKEKYENKIKIKINPISDTSFNTLNTEIPGYMQNRSYIQQRGSFNYLYFYNDSLAGYPLIYEKKINIKRLKNELPGEIYSMLSPYIFFNSIYYNLNVTKESIDILESFPEYLEPLKATLQYEIFYLNKKTEEAKNYRDLIYSKYPGEIWRLKDIEKGTGIISYLMRMGKLK